MPASNPVCGGDIPLDLGTRKVALPGCPPERLRAPDTELGVVGRAGRQTCIAYWQRSGPSDLLCTLTKVRTMQAAYFPGGCGDIACANA